ncbi:MAG TPA: homocysteine S-methyltransferase family protein [Burkholderiales bacterium]|nr:homocysteine S-methyltransferase family protein [Burkholderiales bacterium]
MSSLYRDALPQLNGGFFVTDGGIETTLIFHQGLELPDFAAFDLFRRPGGETALREYFRAYARIAARYNAHLILESATWRASADWATRLGYGERELAEANRLAIALLERIRDEMRETRAIAVISGCVGPRGDGYQPGNMMTIDQARRYHGAQVDTFAGTAADMVSAITMNYVEEAIGIALAAQDARMPVAISFTVETDGRLATGQPLADAIGQVDAATGSYPAYYMLNCAHPEHFDSVLEPDASWTARVRGLRANASRKSHAELNESPELDMGDPAELGRQYAELKQRRLPRLNVLGGCCGTDHRHVESIAAACAPLFRHALR